MSSSSRPSSSSQVEDINEDRQRVIQLLNEACLCIKGPDKVQALRKVQEIVVYKSSSLLDEHLEDVVNFQNDPSQEAKKFVLGFLEVVCRQHPRLLSKVLPSVRLFLFHESPTLVKRAIQCFSKIVTGKTFESFLQQCSQKEESSLARIEMKKLEKEVFFKTSSPDEEIAILSLKFCESTIMVQVPSLPVKNKVFESNEAFQTILKCMQSSESNKMLTTGIKTLGVIAKNKPIFFTPIIHCIETLLNNVSSGDPNLKQEVQGQLLKLLSICSSRPLKITIREMLTSLGTTEDAIRSKETSKKRPRSEVEENCKEFKSKVPRKRFAPNLTNVPGPTIKPILDLENMKQMMFTRLVNFGSNRDCHLCETEWFGIVMMLVANSPETYSLKLLEFILEDACSRLELAIAWTYDTYVSEKLRCNLDVGTFSSQYSYDDLTLMLLDKLLKHESDRAILLSQLFLGLPKITPNILTFFKNWAARGSYLELELSVFRTVIENQPTRASLFVPIILDLTLNFNPSIRNIAIDLLKELYISNSNKETITSEALKRLNTLSDPKENSESFNNNSEDQTDCLQLILSLLPINLPLLHELEAFFINTDASLKKIILKHLGALRGVTIPHSSTQLIQVIQTSLVGSEFLVSHFLNVILGKDKPSPELAKCVLDLYRKRNLNARVLIPIANGLKPRHIEEVLPKLLELKKNILKMVFQRILGGEESSNLSIPSYYPDMLLIRLCTIGPEVGVDLAKIIEATSVCFDLSEKFTPKVMIKVIENLLAKNSLPILFTRIMLQTILLYPKLNFFILDVLLELVSRRVWEDPSHWAGFIQCCQKTIPNSSTIVLRLPFPQLKQIVESSSELQLALCSFTTNLTVEEKRKIPRQTLSYLKSFG